MFTLWQAGTILGCCAVAVYVLLEGWVQFAVEMPLLEKEETGSLLSRISNRVWKKETTQEAQTGKSQFLPHPCYISVAATAWTQSYIYEKPLQRQCLYLRH